MTPLFRRNLFHSGLEEVDLSGNALGPRDEPILEGAAHRLLRVKAEGCRLTAWPLAAAGPPAPLRSLQLARVLLLF